MSVVYSRVNGNRGRRTGVLIHLLVQNGLQLVIAHVGLIEDDMVVSGTRSTLDGSVRAEVKVVLMGMGL